MTTILEELKRLDDAHARGDVSAKEVRKLRRAILELVEDAEEATDDPDDPVEDVDADDEPQEIPELIRLAIQATLGVAACIGLGAWLFGDAMFGFTIGLGILAIFTIRAFNRLEDMDLDPLNDLLPKQTLGSEHQEQQR